MFHDFTLANEKIRLWQRLGESYEHILMKALGYAMFVGKYPKLEIETKIGLRYKPDLISVGERGVYAFWGECGQNSIRKTNWILKHTRTEKLVLFKIAVNGEQFIKKLRVEVPGKYRSDGKLVLINFVSDIANLTASRQIPKVSKDWFAKFEI